MGAFAFKVVATTLLGLMTATMAYFSLKSTSKDNQLGTVLIVGVQVISGVAIWI